MDIRSNWYGVALSGEKSVANGSGPPPFLSKTYAMVDDPETDSIVSWGPGNNTFVVWNPLVFARDLLPKKIDPYRWEFASVGFLKGQKPLLTIINRRKSSQACSKLRSLPQNASFPSCEEATKLRLGDDIESLKRDKYVLMQELVRLRTKQQTTDALVQALINYTRGMEKRQQQMLSFLYKAIHCPGLLAQLVQQKNFNNHIPDSNKKRRLSNQREFEREIGSSDDQIINYEHTVLTEAVKPVLMQILTPGTYPSSDCFNKFESSPQLGNFHLLTGGLDTSRFSSGSSGISFQNAPLSAGVPNVPEYSGIFSLCSSPVTSKIQYSPNVTETGESFRSVAPEELSQAVFGLQQFGQLQGMMADECAADINNTSNLASAAENILVFPFAGVDEMIPGELENSSGDAEVDILNLCRDMKLPGIFDSFWEQFL